MKFSPTPALGTFFFCISLFGIFFFQMSEFWYFSCWKYDSFLQFWKLFEKSIEVFHFFLKWVKYDSFLQVLKTFRKIEKIEVFAHPGPRDIFFAFHSLASFSSKWVNFDILVVLKWKYDSFLQFWKLFEKSKKLKFSPTPALGTFFLPFTLWHLFLPNEWILIF